MGSKHTLGELNNLSREELITIILSMQEQLDALNENIEKLIEQVRLANQQRFGRHTETMASIEGQLSFLMKQMPCVIRLYRSRIRMRSSLKKQRRKIQGATGSGLKGFPGRCHTNPHGI